MDAIGIIGWLERAVRAGWQQYWQRARVRRRDLLVSSKVSEWVIQYYQRRSQGQYLYRAQVVGQSSLVPFVTRPLWHGPDWEQSHRLTFDGTSRSQTPVNDALIKKRDRLGYRQENRELFSLVDVVENGQVELRFGLCSFYQFVSAIANVEEETLKCARWPRRAASVRDGNLNSVDRIASCPLGAHGMGIHCVTAFWTGTEWMVLLQKRAERTLFHAGSWGVVPTFCFQPLFAAYREEFSVQHQFLREFGEELLDLEEVALSGRRLVSDWFYRNTDVEPLVAYIQRTTGSLRVLGFGFDVVTCEPNLAVLATITDVGLWQKFRGRIRANWEMSNIAAHTIDDPALGRLISDGALAPGGAFSLSEALSALKRQQRSQPSSD